MPSFELNFLPDEELEATDEQLLLQLVYGICKALKNPREEKCTVFVTSYDMPHPLVRRVAKLLVNKCGLAIPESRVDDWVEWHQKNQCWVVSDKMSAEADKLMKVGA